MQPSNAHDSHLSLERLAAFDDRSSGDMLLGETPFSAEELAHLAMCAVCRAERDAVAQVVAMAAAVGAREGTDAAPRLVEFEQIMAGLHAHDASASAGMTFSPAVTMPTAMPASSRPRRTFAPMLRQAAAALLLVSGGVLLGRMSGEVSGAMGVGASASAGVMRTPAGSATATPASLTDRPFADQSFASIDQATAALNQAQRDYERASLWLASNDSTVRDPEVFRARLAALDQMMEASRVALRDAPQDPVLNHYYLAASSAREATLQALLGALPVDKTIERY